MTEAPFVQVVMFHTRAGFTEADVLEVAAQIKADVEAVAGCQRWELYQAADGRWVELIYWDSPTAAEQGNVLMMTKASAARAFEMTDEPTVNVLHLSPVTVMTP